MSLSAMKNVGLLVALVCLFSAMLAQASLVKRSTDSDDATDQAAIIIPGLVGPTIIGPTVIGTLNTGCLGLPYSYRGFCHYSQCYRVPYYYRHLCAPTHVIPLSQDSDSASAATAISRPAELNVEDSEEKNRKKRNANEGEQEDQEELTQRRTRCYRLGLPRHYITMCVNSECWRIPDHHHHYRRVCRSLNQMDSGSDSAENQSPVADAES